MCSVYPAGLQVSLNAAQYQTIEGTAANITLVTSTPNYAFPFDVFLRYMELDGITATEGMDYIPLPDSVSFAAGQERLSFEVDIPDDQVAELLESFRVETVGYSSCLDGLVVDGRATSAFVTIEDNDSEHRVDAGGCGNACLAEVACSFVLFCFVCCCLELVVSLMPDVYTVSEGDSVTVTLVTNIPYTFEFDIEAEGSSVTAMGMATPGAHRCSGHSHPSVSIQSPFSTAGLDFEPGPVRATFSPSINSTGSANVTFQTLADSVFEGEEVFLVNLMTVDSNVKVDVTVGPDRGLVLIEDQTSERPHGRRGRGMSWVTVTLLLPPSNQRLTWHSAIQIM